MGRCCQCRSCSRSPRCQTWNTWHTGTEWALKVLVCSGRWFIQHASFRPWCQNTARWFRESELKPRLSVGADLPYIQFLAYADAPEMHRRRARRVLKPQLNVGLLGHWKSDFQDCALHRFPTKYPWQGSHRFALPSARGLTTVTCVCEGAAEATAALASCLWRALRLWHVICICASDELSPLPAHSIMMPGGLQPAQT